MVAKIATEASVNGVDILSVRFVWTPKNQPARDFLPRHGFVEDEDGIWRAKIADIPAIPEGITVSGENSGQSAAKTG